MNRPSLHVLALAIVLVSQATPAPASQELPFDTTNLAPLVQIYGLPGVGAAQVLAPNRTRADVHVEAANHRVAVENGTESLFFDGETHRTTLKLSRGWSGGREVGIEIPYVRHSGGFLDSFIEGWHDFFGLPQGGRDQMPPNQLLYQYRRDGIDRVNLSQAAAGIGDVRLTLGQAWTQGDQGATDATLRFSLKVPTGDSDRLLGSGAPDAAVWISIACREATCTGPLSWYGGGGLLWVGRGDVLPDQQRRVVGFGSGGLHWKAFQRVTLAAQIDGHTPFYTGSELRPLSDTSFQLVLGGMWRVQNRHTVEIAITEDLAVDTAPDVVLRLGLRSWF